MKQEEPDTTEIAAMIDSVHPGAASPLLPILIKIQEKFGFLPPSALRLIGEHSGIPASDIEEVSSFYSSLRKIPMGRHSIKVCIGTACHVKGAEKVYESLKRHLGIGEGEDTDSASLFTLEKVACLGCCMLAPAVQIDRNIYGAVSPAEVPSMIADFLLSSSSNAGEELSEPGFPHRMGSARICICSSCAAAGANAVYAEILEYRRSSSAKFAVFDSSCSGISFRAPLMELTDSEGNAVVYERVRPENVAEILKRHFKPSGIVRCLGVSANLFLERMLCGEKAGCPQKYPPDVRQSVSDDEFSGRQTRIVTERAGSSRPLDLEDYLGAGGFSALRTALKMRPEDIVEMIRESGLRGSGGAGFSSGKKWEFVARMPSLPKYLICNGDEGDPGAFMDRMILESFPFRVIEGMAIAAFATGAREAFVYVRSEYPLAVSRMEEAIGKAAEKGCLALDAAGNRDDVLRIHVFKGAGAFVCGEESALIRSMEGRRPVPGARPPYPGEKGLWGRPTLVNNVETFANIPWIVANSPGAFSKIGTMSSRGTKTFALAGRIARGGLIEVPMGIGLDEIATSIGGGTVDGKRIKAIQIGGPSGGCIPFDQASVQLDYESLKSMGSMMGSGGIIVLDESDCIVEMARYFMSFTKNESCGKCSFCRLGTEEMLEILERLTEGTADKGDLLRLERLGEQISRGSLCGLGKTAPNPVLTSIRYFRDEYYAHLQGECPAKKCKKLICYEIGDECVGCTLCARNCCQNAIVSSPYAKHRILDEKCVRCGTCFQICPLKAVQVRS